LKNPPSIGRCEHVDVPRLSCDIVIVIVVIFNQLLLSLPLASCYCRYL